MLILNQVQDDLTTVAELSLPELVRWNEFSSACIRVVAEVVTKLSEDFMGLMHDFWRRLCNRFV
jgi:hypothetical protein